MSLKLKVHGDQYMLEGLSKSPGTYQEMSQKQWKWLPDTRRWATSNPKSAKEYEEFADERCQKYLKKHLQGLNEFDNILSVKDNGGFKILEENSIVSRKERKRRKNRNKLSDEELEDQYYENLEKLAKKKYIDY